MKIYVGNLAYTVTEESLKDVFGQYGEVTSVKIIKDKFTGKARGFGFVEMSDDDQAQEAIAALNGKDIEGRTARVNEARPPQQTRPRNNGIRIHGPLRDRQNPIQRKGKTKNPRRQRNILTPSTNARKNIHKKPHRNMLHRTG